MKKRTVFYGGKIITMNKDMPEVDAVYVEDGVIKKTGRLEEIACIHPGTEFVDLKGNVMMPGFIEPHIHYDLCSMISKMHIISGIRYPDTADVLAEIERAVESTPEGKWVMCFGLDYLINRDLPEMDRYRLDRITDRHPLALIIQSMHTMYINSMGLERAGIDRYTKDTRDGHLIRDGDGEPLGILTEQGFLVPIVKLWLDEIEREPMELLFDEVPRWVKNGITTVWTAGYSPLYEDHFNLMREFFSSSYCPLRGDYSLSFNSIESGMVPDTGSVSSSNEKTRMTGIKSWYDGSPYTGNMLMYENYLENPTMQDKLFIPPGQCGEHLFDTEAFYGILKKYHDEGHQLSIHAQGDRACHEVLRLIDRVLEESDRKEHRHRMEHCAFMDRKDLDLCGKLGVSLSYHTDHLYYYGEALRDLVTGPDTAEKMLPCRSSLDRGVRISFHSDAPMYEPEPLRVAANAVTRTSRSGTVIGREEAITVDEALRGITIDAAWQLMRENEIGSIEEGKLADFTILAEDPYEVDPLRMGDISVVKTYIGGEDTSLFECMN